MAEPTCSVYLGYLDKEMTIMGILSAFAVVLGGLSLEHTAGADSGTPLRQVWDGSRLLVATGAASAVIAGLFFYLQRSLMAWHFGQIVLRETRKSGTYSVEELLESVDAWDSWVRYQLGFVALYVSFTLLGLAVFRPMVPPLAGCAPGLLLTPVLLCAAVYSVALRYVLRKYRLEDEHPWVVLWSRVVKRRRRKSK